MFLIYYSFQDIYEIGGKGNIRCMGNRMTSEALDRIIKTIAEGSKGRIEEKKIIVENIMKLDERDPWEDKDYKKIP